MKLLSLIAFTLFAAVSTARLAASDAVQVTQEINWLTDIKQAQKIAKNKNIPIYLYFSGSDWCPHCIKMDKNVHATAAFQNALKDKVVYMHVDTPKHKKLSKETQEQNDDLKKQFSIRGFPTVLIVDADLNLIAKPERKADPAQFAKEVQKVLTAN